MQLFNNQIQREFETKTKAANATAALLGFIPVIVERNGKILSAYEKQSVMIDGEYEVINEPTPEENIVDELSNKTE